MNLKKNIGKLEQKVAKTRSQSVEASLFRPRRTLTVVIICLAIAILLLFLLSSTISGIGQKETIKLTPLGTSQAAGDDTTITLTRWDYDPNAKTMEIELDLDTTYLDDQLGLGVNLLTDSDSQVSLKVAYSCDTFFVFQAKNVPSSAYYKLICLVTTKDDSSSKQYSQNYYGAEQSMTVMENLDLNKTENDYLMESYEANYAILTDIMSGLKQQKSELEASISADNATIEDLQNSLSDMTASEKSQANSRISSLQAAVKTNEDSLKAVNEKIDSTQKEMDVIGEKEAAL